MTIEIALTKGYVAVVDDEDADLARDKWTSHSGGYAYRTVEGQSKLMHRVILERLLERPLVKGEQCDHIDGDKLNNRRINLRVCRQAQNLWNAPVSKNNTSGYKGVQWHKPSRKWMARIKVDGESHYLGLFADPAEAHDAYMRMADELCGEFAASPERTVR